MVKGPIWKDTYYTTTADTLAYYIKLDGGIIYSGRAVKMPDADDLTININKVCRNYLSSEIEELLETSSASTVNYEACRTFTLTDSAGTTLEQYMFLYDYDYDHNWNGQAATLSLPINGHFIDGMLKLKTTVTTGGTVTTYKATGNYPVQVSCGDVLYYLNTRGGWDAFVFEGNTIKTDKLTTYSTDRVFNNTTYEFENNRYVAEIKTAYQLNTGLLNDEQSANFAKNLLGSNKCYLHLVSEGKIKPVVITDTNVTYLTYQTNGRKLSQYKLNVEESQSKIRK